MCVQIVLCLFPWLVVYSVDCNPLLLYRVKLAVAIQQKGIGWQP